MAAAVAKNTSATISPPSTAPAIEGIIAKELIPINDDV